MTATHLHHYPRPPLYAFVRQTARRCSSPAQSAPDYSLYPHPCCFDHSSPLIAALFLPPLAAHSLYPSQILICLPKPIILRVQTASSTSGNLCPRFTLRYRLMTACVVVSSICCQLRDRLLDLLGNTSLSLTLLVVDTVARISLLSPSIAMYSLRLVRRLPTP